MRGRSTGGDRHPRVPSRRRDHDERLPPGQYVTPDFPVLSAGPTPHIEPATWTFDLVSEHGERVHRSWADLMRLPIENVTTDIHCVTRWSKFDTRWRGVSLDQLLPAVQTSARYAMVHSHGGPARMLIPHLYFWKSAKWVRGLTLILDDEPGFWERNGYSLYGDPWTEDRYA